MGTTPIHVHMRALPDLPAYGCRDFDNGSLLSVAAFCFGGLVGLHVHLAEEEKYLIEAKVCALYEGLLLVAARGNEDQVGGWDGRAEDHLKGLHVEREVI